LNEVLWEKSTSIISFSFGTAYHHDADYLYWYCEGFTLPFYIGIRELYLNNPSLAVEMLHASSKMISIILIGSADMEVLLLLIAPSNSPSS